MNNNIIATKLYCFPAISAISEYPKCATIAIFADQEQYRLQSRRKSLPK